MANKNNIEQEYLVSDDYNSLIVIEDEQLKSLTYNKELEFFEGLAFWVDKEIYVCLERCNDANIRLIELKKLLSNSKDWDKRMRNFCAEKLIKSARYWQEKYYINSTPISQENFAHRVFLKDISMWGNGDFTAYYDDSMLRDNIIIVDGNINGRLMDAYTPN